MTKRLQVAWIALALASAAASGRPGLLSDLVDAQRTARGELLLLPGSDLTPDDAVLVYSRGRSATVAPLPDSPWPHGLIIEMPEFVAADHPVELRLVRAPEQPPVLLNQPRAAWFSPVSLPADPLLPGARELWVVGRALDQGGSGPMLRLTGASELRVAAPVVQRDDYLVYELPPDLLPGPYTVSIAAQAGEWETVADLRLQVEAHGNESVAFDPRNPRHGGCLPDDELDDGACLRRALSAASAAGGGAVTLAPGRWRLRLDSNQPGLTLAPGTAIVGEAGRSILELDWGASNAPYPALTLLGNNRVRGLRFIVAAPAVVDSPPRTVLQLGPPWQAAGPAPRALRDIKIDGNDFDGVYRAVADGGLPVERLDIRNNRFAAFETALQLGGDRFRTTGRFRLVDSVIADNLFEPGALFDAASGRGPIASEIGGSLRLRFSGNVAAAADRPVAGLPRGWRAAFFWHLQDSQEDLLIARNVALCPGGLIGDGEGIALDNNGATSAYDGAAVVVSAAGAQVTLRGALRRRQHDREIARVDAYAGHWLQIVDGEGRGQARRVLAHSSDGATGHERFRLEQAWGRAPAPGARVVVTRGFVRARVVDNHIDQRASRCARRNQSGPRGGAISLWAHAVDVQLKRNVVDEGDGLILNHSWSNGAACRGCGPTVLQQWHTRVTDNAVQGENDPLSNCSHSGIELRHGASDASEDRPPLLGFGAIVRGNAVAGADGIFSGSIALPLTWHAGPAGHRTPLIDGYVVQYNAIGPLPFAAARGTCGPARARVPVFVAPGRTVGRGWWRQNSCRGQDGEGRCSAD